MHTSLVYKQTFFFAFDQLNQISHYFNLILYPVPNGYMNKCLRLRKHHLYTKYDSQLWVLMCHVQADSDCVAKCYKFDPTCRPTNKRKRVISNCWTGLCTGSLDWTAGLDYWMTFELNLCVAHDLHPIRCANDGLTYSMLSSYIVMKQRMACNFRSFVAKRA